ncbi:MBL fold metallo-hydrolase [Synechocystis sp. LKSZ1]|uniref:MBL fold metallo-hydrolase n=1 Tax=Synechocystis sp. LKSZ1 TaxID=3144951 RepID=UPI00336BC1A6
MKRRQLIHYTGAGLLATLGSQSLSALHPLQAQSAGSGLSIEWLGHSAFLFTGGGLKILVNPFRAVGCTAGYRLPKVQADLVLISSQLWDEGAAEGLPGNPKILFEPGVYEINGLKIQGIASPHDRVGGRRFGLNIAWRWTQGGIRIVHMGGAAAPVGEEQKILLGTPDLALMPVGGSAKSYTPEEAKAAMLALNPRVMIPTQYATVAADKTTCDLAPITSFLELVKGMNVGFLKGNQWALRPADLPKEGTLIRVFNERSVLKA